MGNLAYTVTSSRPRTIANVSDWAALPTHGAYGTIDPTFKTRLLSEARNIYNTATASICRNSSGTGSPRDDVHKKVLTLAVANKVHYNQSYAFLSESLNWGNKVVEIARYISDTSIGLTFGVNSRRSNLLAMAYALDLDYPRFLSADITAVGGAIITLCDAMSFNAGPNSSAPELFDGHTAGDQACQFIGAVALSGESGFTSGGNNAATRVQEAVDFWWGGDSAITFNGESRLNFNRYFCAQGGHGKSVWYSMLEGWYTALILHCAKNGLTGMTLSGESYTLPTGESWIDKVGEWFVNFACRGDLDYWHVQGDTERVTNPWMHEYTSTTLAYLIRSSPTFKGPLRWVYDKILAKTASFSQNAVYNRVADYVLFDPGSATYAPVDPETALVSKSKLMDPPGIYVYRNNWDLTGSNHCAIVIEAQNYFWRGHSSDLKCGSIQIAVNDDIALMNRGMYSSSQDAVADFGGSYTNNWSRQTISSSGVVLIDDLQGTATASPNWTGTPHTDQNSSGISTPYPHGQGGQLFRYDHTVAAATNPPPVPIDPYTITKMTSEGSPAGSRWRRTTGIDGALNPGLKVEDTTNDLVFLTCDLHRAFIRKEDDYNTANDRIEVYTKKIMIIRTEGTKPCVFMVDRVRARQSSYVKRQVWNFYGQPNLTSFDTTGRFFASGYRATEQGATALGGKCLVAYYNHAAFRADPSGDNSTTYTGTNANHQAYFVGGSTTLSRFPLAANPRSELGGRQFTDVGRWRVEVKPLVQAQEDTFITLIVPLGKSEVEPDFTLFESATHWCVRFGGEASLRVYKIHKTSIAYEGPTNPLDDVPPSAPTGVNATAGPGSGQVTVSWNLNTEPDYDRARVFYRVKV